MRGHADRLTFLSAQAFSLETIFERTAVALACPVSFPALLPNGPRLLPFQFDVLTFMHHLQSCVASLEQT